MQDSTHQSGQLGQPERIENTTAVDLPKPKSQKNSETFAARLPSAGQYVTSKGKVKQINPATGKPWTRAEKSEYNKTLKNRIEIAELAKDKAAPFRTAVLFKDPDMLPAKLGRPSATAEQAATKAVRKGGRAKQVVAVEAGSSVGVGRPSEYTEEEGSAICAWIASGKSLNRYCIEHGRSHVTVYRWLRERAEFQSMYSQAHEDRADTLVDEMMEIADESANATSVEAVSAAKLRVETRRWIAQKMRAQKYGDKVEVKQTGAVSINIGINSKPQQKAMETVQDVTPRITQPR